MFNLPKPKLGDVTAITMTSTDLETSLSYYQKLGFTEVLRSDIPFPWIQITDGSMLIMIRKDPKPYIALAYYVKSEKMNQVVGMVESLGIKFSETPKAADLVQRYVFHSPDGLTISFVTNIENIFRQPNGSTMLTMAPQDYTNPEKYVNKVCGMFGEFAHPVADLDASLLFWERLGFVTLSKFISPYPWAIISDGLSVVGLHQTKTFSYPAITFFASDMKEKISKLKSDGLKDYSGGENNITLTTPEKQHINLFKLGM